MALFIRNFDRRAAGPGHRSMYAMHDWKYRQHHDRLKRFIAALPVKLVCQECRGSGEFLIEVIEYGRGPMEQCGWCEGIGYVTPHARGRWLKCRRASSKSVYRADRITQGRAG